MHHKHLHIRRCRKIKFNVLQFMLCGVRGVIPNLRLKFMSVKSDRTAFSWADAVISDILGVSETRHGRQELTGLGILLLSPPVPFCREKKKKSSSVSPPPSGAPAPGTQREKKQTHSCQQTTTTTTTKKPHITKTQNTPRAGLPAFLPSEYKVGRKRKKEKAERDMKTKKNRQTGAQRQRR